MKNILICIVALPAVSLHAQDVHFGVKAGLNIASLHRELDVTHYSSKPGFHLGGLAHIHVTPHFAIQPELLYSTQGAKRDEINPETKINLGYINIPVLVQYMFSNGFRLETGPQVGLLTSAKSKTGDIEINMKDNFKGVDFSWVFGLGFISRSGLGADVRYNLGVSNVLENNTNDANNRVLQVGIFYQFGSSRKSK